MSEFPNLSETPVPVLEEVPVHKSEKNVVSLSELPEAGTGEKTLALKAAAFAGQSLPGLMDQSDLETPEPGEARLAEPFEQLRLVADRFEEKTSKAPVVFLASLGALAQFTARATWTANAFAAGGIKTAAPAEYASQDDMIAAFKDSGASLACLVSSDGTYETEAGPAAMALKDAGVNHVYLAGRPGEREAELNNAGVDAFLYAGCDLLELLKDAHARLAGAAGVENSDLEVRS